VSEIIEGRSSESEVMVERSVEVSAPPGTVWEHIIDGTLASEWMGSPITIEPRVGGGVGFAPDEVDFIGTVEDVDEGRSITWSWRHPDRDPSQVTITVEPGEDGTVITVTERLLPYRITDTRTQWPWVEDHGSGPALCLAA
jgi:uncharacterized protein YndB with AHSA1/START domain